VIIKNFKVTYGAPLGMMLRHSHKRNKLDAQHSIKTSWTTEFTLITPIKQTHTEEEHRQTDNEHTPIISLARKKKNNDNKLMIT
jgi:hypothetical protein